MRFKDNARLDTSQVQDSRGRGGMFRGGGFPGLGGGGRGRGMAVGGGFGSLLLVLALLFGGNVLGGSDSATNSFGQPGTSSDLAQECRTGADANARQDCRIVGVVNSVQAFWTDQFRRRAAEYIPADTVFFDDQAATACGTGSGAFYCPADGLVYIDLEFFGEIQERFGGGGGPFAQAYVIAHEYGHHIQDLDGTNERVRTREGATSDSVRLELQADCYAGVWARGAVTTGFIEELTQADIEEGLNAAAAVGDDHIQKTTSGRVDPEGFTHGTSAQRQRWFTTGYQSGDPGSCSTFAASAL